MNTPHVPPPRKGPLILLGIAIGAVGMLMLVIVFLGVAWLGLSARRAQSTPQPFDPLAAQPPRRVLPPGRAPTVERFERTERVQRTERAEDIEPTAAETPASIAPVLHIQSRSGNLLDGKPVALKTSGAVSSIGGYLRVMDSQALRISGPMSISVWFNARTTNRPMAICSRALNGPPWQLPYCSWLLRINDPIHLEGTLTGADGYSPSTWITQPIKPDKWFHAVFTYDGRIKKLYLNGGQAMKLLSGRLDHRGPNQYVPGRAIFIGADESDSPVGDLFDGAIEDLRIFNRALPEEEILELYSSPPNAREGGTGTRL